MLLHVIAPSAVWRGGTVAELSIDRIIMLQVCSTLLATSALTTSVGSTSTATAAVGKVTPTFSKSERLRQDGFEAIKRRQPAFVVAAAKERIQLLNMESAPMFLDETALLAEQDFPYSESQLIRMTKEFLFLDAGIRKPEMLADDMVFMGPFVGGAGGLPRDKYLEAVGGCVNETLTRFPRYRWSGCCC